MREHKPRRRGLSDYQKIETLRHYLIPNPTEPPHTTKYKRRHERRKCIIDHGDYIEVLRRNIRMIADVAGVPRSTFYKVVKDLKSRLAGLDIESLPEELKVAVKAALNGKKINDYLIRTNLTPQKVRDLLEFLYLK